MTSLMPITRPCPAATDTEHLLNILPEERAGQGGAEDGGELECDEKEWGSVLG